MSTLYTTRDDVKDRMDIGDTVDDAALDLIIASVSREVEQFTGRRFQPVTQTRYYGAVGSSVRVDDLLSVSILKTDSSGDRTYATTWATTDYDLGPVNAPQESPPQPYRKIYMAPGGRYGFPCDDRGTQIVGSWAHYDVRRTAGATAAEIMDDSETGFDVSSGSAFKAGQTILVESEQMEISAISSNTLTVVRGVNGSTAAAHASGVAIGIYEYPIVGEATLHQVTLVMQARGAGVSGVLGSPEFGTPIRQVGIHPLVARALKMFRLPVIA